MNEVTIQEKKQFLKWFCERFTFQKKEALWLLNYLYYHDSLLPHIHFTDNIRGKDKTLMISTSCMPECYPFLFQKKGKVSSDVKKSFHDIRLNPAEDTYILLFFKDKIKSPEYAAISEEIPSKQQEEEESVVFTPYPDALIAEIIMDKIIRKQRIWELEQQIDESLCSNKKHKFKTLSKEWAELKKLEKM